MMISFDLFNLLFTSHLPNDRVMSMTKPATIDEYIGGFPTEVQQVLEEVRETIRQAAPGATEGISYAMPAFSLHGSYLVYFAAFKSHIGLYALPTAHKAFEEDFSHYKTGKGSVQFPLNKPMPLELIGRVVKFRVKENAEKAKKTTKQ